MQAATPSPSPTYTVMMIDKAGDGLKLGEPTVFVAPSATPAPPVATVPPAPTAPPAGQQTAGEEAATAPAPLMTRFVLGDQVDPRFHKGMFRYTAPATPPPIDDPRFYRGSFTINEAGHLAPTPAAAPTSIPPAAAATAGFETTGGKLELVPAVKEELYAKEELYTVPTPDTAPVTGPGAVVTYDKLNPSYMAQSPLPVRGRAMYYNPGIMPEVLSYRLQLKQVEVCGDCVGYVALLRAGDLNRKVWLQWDDGTVEGPFLVIDVAARHHVPSLLARSWVVDVDYPTAMRRGMNQPIPVTVLAAPPATGN